MKQEKDSVVENQPAHEVVVATGAETAEPSAGGQTKEKAPSKGRIQRPPAQGTVLSNRYKDSEPPTHKNGEKNPGKKRKRDILQSLPRGMKEKKGESKVQGVNAPWGVTTPKKKKTSTGRNSLLAKTRKWGRGKQRGGQQEVLREISGQGSNHSGRKTNKTVRGKETKSSKEKRRRIPLRGRDPQLHDGCAECRKDKSNKKLKNIQHDGGKRLSETL